MRVFLRMARDIDLNDQFAGLDIEEEENSAFVLEGEGEAEGNKYELCVVGRFLTGRSINVNAMKTKMADVWRPAMGVNIKEVESGIFLFQFFHKEDKNWVLKGGPWSFDNAMIVMAEIPEGEEPLNVPLWHVNIWLQLYDLPSGFMSETVGRLLGDFFGEFLEYDSKNNSSLWREFMRIRVRLDVRKPLKRRKKITKKNGAEVMVSCKYERLGEFCFTCGMLTHTERYCRIFLSRSSEESSKEWGSWLRAPPRKTGGPVRSRYLRGEDDTEWEARQGRYNSGPKSGGGSYGAENNSMILGNPARQATRNQGDITNPLLIAARNMEGRRENSNLEDTGGNGILNIEDGPDLDETTGLLFTDRKRLRGGPDKYDVMDIPGGLGNSSDSTFSNKPKDVGLSGMDCSTSNNSQLATLAQQASRTP